EVRYPTIVLRYRNYMIVLEGFKALRSIVRIAWIAMLACGGLIVVGHLLRQLNIVVNPLVWSSAQIITALLSFTIAANVLVRYHGTGNRVSLLLGLAFAVTGAIHLISILEFYDHFLAYAENFRVPLSWMVGQTILALVFLFAYTLDRHLPWPRAVKRNIVAVLAIVIAASFLVAISFLAFPNEPPIHPQ